MDGRQYLVKRTSGEEVQCGLASVADPGLWMDMDAAEVALLQTHASEDPDKIPEIIHTIPRLIPNGPPRPTRLIDIGWSVR